MDDVWVAEHYYLLGFFYADGCLHTKTKKHKHSLSVTICKKDEIVINAFKRLFGGCTYNTRKGLFYRWYLSSEFIYNKFIELGLTPKKSLTLTEIPKIPSIYLRDFIRGYFDGDGSAWITKNNNLMTSFCGTRSFLESINKCIYTHTDLTMERKINPHKNIFDIRYSQSQSFELYKWIYYDNCLCLARKKVKFEQSIIFMNSLKRTRNLWLQSEIDIIKENYEKLGIVKTKELLPTHRTLISIRTKFYRLKN